MVTDTAAADCRCSDYQVQLAAVENNVEALKCEKGLLHIIVFNFILTSDTFVQPGSLVRFELH